jgi:histone acetyltransferase MYST1
MEVGDRVLCRWVDGSVRTCVWAKTPGRLRAGGERAVGGACADEAEIVERRKRGEILPLAAGAAGSVDPSALEFYVHWVGRAWRERGAAGARRGVGVWGGRVRGRCAGDRRLDDWVAHDRFVGRGAGGDGPSSPESRLARSRRRGEGGAAGGGGAGGGGGGAGPQGTPTAATSERAASEARRAAADHEHESVTRVKNIRRVELGRWEMDAWYFSPYPEEYTGDKLYVCEFTLKYFRKKRSLERHKRRCGERHPPGQEIYRDGALSVFEVDGREQRVYCQNLCLLSKLFLDHKTLYFDVDPFWFYVLTEVDEHGAHVVGYFSKEKHSEQGYNLACILTLPPYQRKGYGKFLISFSYLLSRREGKVGSPEKPLSDLGKVSYRSYWSFVLLAELERAAKKEDETVTVKSLSRRTAIKVEDILSTLQALGMIRVWRTQHVVSIKASQINQVLQGNKSAKYFAKDDCLHWSPPGKRDPPTASKPSASSSSSASSSASSSSSHAPAPSPSSSSRD